MTEMANQTLHMQDAPKEIAVSWYLRGKKDPDVLSRFIAYWISFSQLYQYGYLDFDGISEIERIEAYCRDKHELLAQLVDFDAPYMNAFKARPVITGAEDIAGVNWAAGNMNRIIIKMTEAFGEDPAYTLSQDTLRQIASDYINVSRDAIPLSYRIPSLFTTICRIRRNLFHGMANANGAQDLRLLESAAAVLERCLPVLLTDTFHLNG